MNDAAQEQYDDPDDEFDPEYERGTPQEIMERQRELVLKKYEAGRAKQFKVPPEDIERLSRMVEAHTAKIDPETVRRLNEMAGSSFAKLPSETVEKLTEAAGTGIGKIPPETIEKLRASVAPKMFGPETTRALEKFSQNLPIAQFDEPARIDFDPIVSPFESGRTGVRKPLLPEPTPVRWWQTTAWKVSVETAQIVGGIAALITIAILLF